MNNLFSKTYFAYLWKKYRNLIFIMLGIMILLYPVLVLIMKPDIYERKDDVGNLLYLYTTPSGTYLYLGTIVSLVFSFLAPIFARSLFLKKSNCDLFFALPVKKKTQYITISVFNYLAVFACFTITFLLGMLSTLLKGIPINYLYFLFYYLGMILFTLEAFATSTLMCSISNNTLDCVLHLLLLVAVEYLFYAFLNSISKSSHLNNPDTSYTNKILVTTILPIGKADFFTTMMERLAAFTHYGTPSSLILDKENLLPFILSLITPLIIIPVFFLISFLYTKHYQAEDAEETTHYWFSYKTLLPIQLCLIASLLTYTQWTFSLLILIFSFVATLGLAFLYQRKFRFNTWLLVSLPSATLIGVILSLAIR